MTDFIVHQARYDCQVEIEATTKEPGTPLRAPTMESGLVTACKDTCYGDLRLQLWEKKYDNSKGKVQSHGPVSC